MDKEAIAKKGREGEAALRAWFDAMGLGYVAVCNQPETFAHLFHTDVKRPDFLVLIDSVGIIAVDAKHRASYDDGWGLDYGAELQRAIAFERLFRLPIWYVYFDTPGDWHWISALKAIEVGEEKWNTQTETTFLYLRKRDFVRITGNDDLSKLYQQRIGSAAKIAKMRTAGQPAPAPVK